MKGSIIRPEQWIKQHSQFMQQAVPVREKVARWQIPVVIPISWTMFTGDEVPDGYSPLDAAVEWGARTSRRSWHKFGTAPTFIKKRVEEGDFSVLEHASLGFFIISSRFTMTQLLRHRHLSPTQESLRGIDPLRGLEWGDLTWRHVAEFTVIPPAIMNNSSLQQAYITAVGSAMQTYLTLREEGVAKEDARSVLPLSWKTSAVVTGNLRTWREVFTKRIHKAAQWEIRRLMILAYVWAKVLAPKSMFEQRSLFSGTNVHAYGDPNWFTKMAMDIRRLKVGSLDLDKQLELIWAQAAHSMLENIA